MPCKITIEIEGEIPVVLHSTSEKPVIIIGFHLKSPPPFLTNEIFVDDQVRIVGDRAGKDKE